MNTKLTVFFEDPFWVGVFEKEDEEGYSIAKVTFGPEPTEVELYNFLLNNYEKIIYSFPVGSEKLSKKIDNPKRLQKEAKKELAKKGIGTKAQNALKTSFELCKKEKQNITKKMKEEIEKNKFILRQLKKKKKKLGH